MFTTVFLSLRLFHSKLTMFYYFLIWAGISFNSGLCFGAFWKICRSIRTVSLPQKPFHIQLLFFWGMLESIEKNWKVLPFSYLGSKKRNLLGSAPECQSWFNFFFFHNCKHYLTQHMMLSYVLLKIVFFFDGLCPIYY